MSELSSCFARVRKAVRPHQLLATLALSSALCAVLPAFAGADDSDSNFFRIGGERVIFHDHNAGFQGPDVPPNVALTTQAQNLSATYFSLAHGFNPHLEAEVDAGLPPTYKANAKGIPYIGSIPYNGQQLVTTKVMSLGVTMNYKFNEPSDFYRPYLGVGMVYTHFYDIQGTAAGDAITGGATNIRFSDSFGLLAVAGVTLKVADHWRVHFSISHADVRPAVTTETAGVKRINNLDLQPTIFVGALSYGF